jgi:hypothetical protein
MTRARGSNRETAGKRDRELLKRERRAEKIARRSQGWEAVAAEREQRFNRGPQPGQPIEDWER